MELLVAKDRRTGFPCLQKSGDSDWVALLPVTKLQVEQWIWEGGLDHAEDAEEVTALIDRLELTPLPPEYPSAVQEIYRRPLAGVGPADLTSLVASHLSLWESPEEIRRGDVLFPTPRSEWGRVVRWLRGRVPRAREWRLTLDSFGRFRSLDLVQQILALDLEWPAAVETLLARLGDALAGTETGLPFMRLGLYELIAEMRPFVRLAANPPETLHRPLVAGESRIWPGLDPPGVNRWRPVLQPLLPIVALRLWFPRDTVEIGAAGSVSLSVAQPTAAGVAAAGPRRRTGRHVSSSGRYQSSRTTMAARCPICYGPVDRELFSKPAPLWCYKVGSDANKHSDAPPDRSLAIAFQEAVHQDYLKVARRDPASVRSVTLSGFTKAGKGTWLLGLAGLMYYPAGRPRLLSSFPADWHFTRTVCSTGNFVHQEMAVNLQRQMEDLWIEGDVPVRTAAEKRVLRYPFLFRRSGKGLLRSAPQELVLVFNDIAGDIIIDTVRMATDLNLVHLAATTDILFLIPADEIHTGDQFLDRFANGLGALSFVGRALDPQAINLVLCISQIDKLKHGSPRDRELLSVLLREPYLLPEGQNSKEMEDYLAVMAEIHSQLAEWLTAEVPALVQAAQRFASVRYCGFSALGCEVVRRSNKAGSDSCLPFEPQPVRIVDPLFWLFLENDFMGR